jgi:phenylacetate-CoA ligase
MTVFTQAYAPLYRNVLFPLYEGVLRRRGIYRRYRTLSTAPSLGIEELREAQRRKLNAMLVYCGEHVPFYRDLFAQRGIDPRSVHDIDTLRERGLLLDRRQVQSAGASMLSREFTKSQIYSRATGGSSGVPVLCCMDIDNWAMRTATKYRSEDWVGKPLGTPTTIIWGRKPNQALLKRLKKPLYWAFQNYQYLSAFDIGDDRLVKGVAAIKRHGSRFIEAYVTAVYLMAKTIARHGLVPPRLDGIIVGAERLYDFQKEEIERRFQCPVFNRYGATEFGNVASECEKREGLHINVDNLWVEVVDEHDRPVVGQVGDIVITDLDNRAMPLIRYRIGDRGILTDKSCSCGRSFPMLTDVVGRVADTMRTVDGREIHSMYFVNVLSRAPGLVRFLITQDSLTHIRIDVEQDGTVDREVTSRWMREALVDLDRYQITYTIEYTDAIPLTEAGKMRFFVSALPSRSQAPVEPA